MTRYLKITQVDGTRFILRVTGESPRFISGIEVDTEGEEVVPRETDTRGRRYHQRQRVVERTAIKKALPMRMNPTYAALEPVTQTHATVRKSTVQLDAEIAEALSTYDQRAHVSQSNKLRPVEGLHIPTDSRSELNRFWRAHPALRKGCLRKYGFDPIDEEEAYWRYGLAEPDHLSLLREVQRNNNIFSLLLVQRWEGEELQHKKADGASAHQRTTRKR